MPSRTLTCCLTMLVLSLAVGEARGSGYLLLTAGGGHGGTAEAGSLGLEGGWRGRHLLLGAGLAGIFAGGDWEAAGDNPLMTYEMKRNADLEVCVAVGAAITGSWYLVGTAGWSFDSTTGRTTFNSGTPVEWDPVFGGWKGVYAGNVVVRTGSIINSCHYPFTLGAEYLVYATGSEDGILSLYTSLCSRTCPIEQAAEDLDALGSTVAAETLAWGTVKANYR